MRLVDNEAESCAFFPDVGDACIIHGERFCFLGARSASVQVLLEFFYD